MHIWYAGCLPWAYNGSHGPDFLQDLLQDWLCSTHAWGLHRPLPLLPTLQGPPDCLGWQGLVQGLHSSCSSCASSVNALAGECKPSLLSVRLDSTPVLHATIQLPGINHSTLVAQSLQPVRSQSPVVLALKVCSATVFLSQS